KQVVASRIVGRKFGQALRGFAGLGEIRDAVRQDPVDQHTLRLRQTGGRRRSASNLLQAVRAGNSLPVIRMRLNKAGIERQRGAEFLLRLSGPEIIEQFNTSLKP